MELKSKKEEIVDFSRSISADTDFLRLKELYTLIKKRYPLPSVVIFHQLEEQEILIPVTIFNKELSGLEAICKYLRENIGLTNKSIAQLLNRSEKTTWQAYNSSKNKAPDKYLIIPTQYTIPLSSIKSRKFSVLESIVKQLKESFNLNYHSIGELLARNERTIWTVYNRATKKQNAQI